MLNARAIALQGLGYGPRLVAVQGFARATPPIAYPSGGTGRRAQPRKLPAKRRDRDDDVLMFLLR